MMRAKENKKTITKQRNSTKTNTAKNTPSFGRRRRHQMSNCRSTSRRNMQDACLKCKEGAKCSGKRACAMCACVCVYLAARMHIFAGISIYVMPAPHTHSLSSASISAFSSLNLGADLAFVYAFCMSKLDWPIGMIGQAAVGRFYPSLECV